jgi:hypothetical protein
MIYFYIRIVITQYSALTSYLQEQGISAAEIRRSHDLRNQKNSIDGTDSHESQVSARTGAIVVQGTTQKPLENKTKKKQLLY